MGFYILNSLKETWQDTLSLLYPRVCAGCDKTLVKGEEILCVECMMEIPLTDSYIERDNWVEKLFWGRTSIQYAMALCEFRGHTRVQNVLHTIKYHNRPDVAVYMGKWMGSYLNDTVFNTCDAIIPVPLHPHRLRHRGFNQSDSIAEGISHTLNIPKHNKTLYRGTSNVSQTKKSRYARWGNVSNIFAVDNNAILHNKHILLVDDVITTGATLESCAQVLLSMPGTKVSIAALACAMQ